jgi:hypothetical protein
LVKTLILAFVGVLFLVAWFMQKGIEDELAWYKLEVRDLEERERLIATAHARMLKERDIR